MREYAKHCPNPDCDYTSYDNDACPDCGLPLKKPEGETYYTEEEDVMPIASDESLLEDELEGGWYNDPQEGFETI